MALFGRAAAGAERALWRDHRGAGAAHTALCVGGAVGATLLAGRAARAALGRAARPRARPAVRGRDDRTLPRRTSPHRSAAVAADTALAACVAWAVLGGTGLVREARAVAAALEAGDLGAARRRLPHLCGRDPEALDGDGIARAVVESVAENTSDAVVGALVWGAVAGPLGMAGFRAVNTLDAMVGHRSPRHRRFGWAAARLDDVAGRPGARLTALLAVLAGPDPRGALAAWRRDAPRHPSPNAGPVEAAFAGALGVRLGGTLAYGGRVEHRPVLNGSGAPVRTADIERAVRLSRRIGALALLVTAGGRTAAHLAGTRRRARRAAAAPAARTAPGRAAFGHTVTRTTAATPATPTQSAPLTTSKGRAGR